MKTISKKLIIKALLTEPLRPGHWVSPAAGKSDKHCTVCAVGAVMRAAKFVNEKISVASVRNTNSYYSKDHDLYLCLAAGKHLSALSIFFEQICPEHGATKKVRERLVAFVTAHFPDTLTLIGDRDAYNEDRYA